MIKKSIDIVLYNLDNFVFYKDNDVEKLIKDYKFLRNIITEQEKAFDKIKE